MGGLLSGFYVISVEEYFQQTITVSVFKMKGRRVSLYVLCHSNLILACWWYLFLSQHYGNAVYSNGSRITPDLSSTIDLFKSHLVMCLPAVCKTLQACACRGCVPRCNVFIPHSSTASSWFPLHQNCSATSISTLKVGTWDSAPRFSPNRPPPGPSVPHSADPMLLSQGHLRFALAV